MAEPFVLASNSPRRRRLFAKLEIPFQVVPSSVREDYSIPEAPEETPLRLALEKARQVGSLFPDLTVIGADTVVVIEGNILGKPRNGAKAKEMLKTLSGKTHTVYTGVALVRVTRDAEYSFLERTDVTFVPLSEEMIHHYVSTYNPFDKAGAYGIQDWSACFIESVSGCAYNVMGFPISRFLRTVQNRDVESLFGPYNWFGKVDDKP